VKGLLLRLSALDADAEAAVRVIAYFDRLVESGATTREAVRATAALAECAAGWADATGATYRVAPDGAELPAETAGEPSRSVPVDPAGAGAAGGNAARVWLERAGGSAPLDDLVLERLALTVRLLGTARLRTPAPNLADPALVELVLAEREAHEDRARAVHLLGLAAGRPVRVLAVRPAPGQDPVAVAVALVCRGYAEASGHRTVRVAAIGDVAAVLLQPAAGAESELSALRGAVAELTGPGALSGGTGPAGGAVRGNGGRSGTPARVVRAPGRPAAGSAVAGPGVPRPAVARARPGSAPLPGRDAVAAAALGGAAPPLEARRSWLQARLALRFAVPGVAESAFVDHDTLGTLALIAEVPAHRLRTDPDVLALDALAATRVGAQDVAALDAFCRTGSLRQAAAELHLHHSSVAARLARVEQAVGWRLDTTADRFRARLALVARRLAGSA
jgi:hypothetical protein